MSKDHSNSSCFVANIDIKLADKLREDLVGQGFELSCPPYTIFSAKKQGLSCTLYTSGKLTVQGKGQKEFITYYLEPEILKDFPYSYPEQLVDLEPRIGIDEAGKGDFFGPLCIAGLFAGNDQVKQLIHLNVRDSKRMSDQSVLAMSAILKTQFAHHIVRIFPKKYNEMYESFGNLNHLLAWGHATSIEELVKKTGCKKVVIDQFAAEHVVENALKRKNMEVDLTQRHYGESDVVVAGASILARAAFLEGLATLGQNLNETLPKGASQQVIKAGKKLVLKHGPLILNEVAKVHFKTKEIILSDSHVDQTDS